jgi:hypothetical protein
MRVAVLLCLLLSVIGGLTADPLYTWVDPPVIPDVNPDGTTVYSGIIMDESGLYFGPTVQYGGQTFNIDVATFQYPALNEVDFFVLSLTSRSSDPSSIPEPNFLPITLSVLVTSALCFIRAAHRRAYCGLLPNES